jgi:hypothetical protein
VETVGRGTGRRSGLHCLPQEGAVPSAHQERLLCKLPVEKQTHALNLIHNVLGQYEIWHLISVMYTVYIFSECEFAMLVSHWP